MNWSNFFDDLEYHVFSGLLIALILGTGVFSFVGIASSVMSKNILEDVAASAGCELQITKYGLRELREIKC